MIKKNKSSIKASLQYTPCRMLRFFVVFSLAAVFLSACANIGYPEGGPTDETPPKLVSATPPDGTLAFAKDRFELIFDENIDLKNFEEEFLCSPPLKERPDASTSGKKLTVKINNKLDSNITYHFQFGNAIVDLTEANPVPGFEYVVSTGEYIDSMYIRGVVNNAYTGVPEGKVWVMLYAFADFSDSNITTIPPRHVNKTNAEGEFTFRYIANMPYKIVALKDMNGNFFYDMPTEGVAFIEDSILPLLYVKPTEESHPPIAYDSSEVQKNGVVSASPDTLLKEASQKENTLHDSLSNIQLALFWVEDTNQGVLKSDFIGEGIFQIVTKLPIRDFQLESYPHPLFVKQNKLGDTLTLWLPPETKDSILLIWKDGEKMMDTIRENYNKEAISKEKLRPFLTTNVSAVFSFFEQMTLHFSSPIQPFDSVGGIQIIWKTDSLVPFIPLDSVGNPLPDSTEEIKMIPLMDTIYPSYRFTDDSASMTVLLDFIPEKSFEFNMIILGGTFSSVYGEINDTLSFPSKVSKPEDYGNFVLSFQGNPGEAYVLQLLLSSDEKLVREDWIEGSEEIRYEHLKPADYKIRIIEDTDRNKRWSSGDYWKHKQPERIRSFEKPIAIKANWDLEEMFSWEEVPVIEEQEAEPE